VAKTVVVSLALGGLLTLYGAERYSALTTEEIAYVYHPQTDNVYTVVFGAAPDPQFKKQLLLPFQTPTREIKIAEERGSMLGFLREKAARDTLFKTGLPIEQSESVTTDYVRGVNPPMDSVRIFGYRWDFPDMAWVPRRDLDSEDLVPLELSVILPTRSAEWFWEDMYPIDAVVVKEQFHASLAPPSSQPNTVEVLEAAIMIRGRAARYVEKILFNEIGPPALPYVVSLGGTR
jgi:hypothetical protein